MRRYLTYFQIFVRSFFIQSCWNFKSLLSIGFAFSVVPVAKKIFKDDTVGYNGFVKRHLSFFNGHPYFTLFAMGAVAKLEEQIAEGTCDVEKIDRFKNALIGPLGALGDQIFWAIVKPATLTIGVLGFFLIEDISWRLAFLIVLGVLYNIPHFYIRILGLVKGYNEGFGICKYLKIENFKTVTKIYSILGIVSLGLLTGWIGVQYTKFNLYGIAVFAGSIIIATLLKSKKSKTYLAMLLPLSLAVIAGILQSSL